MRRTPQKAKIACSMRELFIDPAYRRSARDAARSLLVVANANASGHARLDPLLTALRRLGARVEVARTGDVALREDIRSVARTGGIHIRRPGYGPTGGIHPHRPRR
jgi:hypothetical protein